MYVKNLIVRVCNRNAEYYNVFLSFHFISTLLYIFQTTACPSSLQLRFQAELNHMESIQEAERQLNQINQLKDMAAAANQQEQNMNEVNDMKQGPHYIFGFRNTSYPKLS